MIEAHFQALVPTRNHSHTPPHPPVPTVRLWRAVPGQQIMAREASIARPLRLSADSVAAVAGGELSLHPRGKQTAEGAQPGRTGPVGVQSWDWSFYQILFGLHMFELELQGVFEEVPFFNTAQCLRVNSQPAHPAVGDLENRCFGPTAWFAPMAWSHMQAAQRLSHDL